MNRDLQMVVAGIGQPPGRFLEIRADELGPLKIMVWSASGLATEIIMISREDAKRVSEALASWAGAPLLAWRPNFVISPESDPRIPFVIRLLEIASASAGLGREGLLHSDHQRIARQLSEDAHTLAGEIMKHMIKGAPV